MADLPTGDPTLGAMTQPQAGNPNATPEEKLAYEAGWFDILSRPEVRSGLLQFGIQAMQPVPIQQTEGGAFANAIGAGVGAYNENISAQNAAQVGDIKLAQQDEELANQRRGQDVTAAGNEMQYKVGMAGVDSRVEIARQKAQIQQKITQELIAGRISQEVARGINELVGNSQFAPGTDVNALIDKLIAAQGRVGGAGAGTPTVPNAVPDVTTPSPTVPPVPDSLRGKDPGWNPRTQRWVTPEGTYNQQGVAVP